MYNFVKAQTMKAKEIRERKILIFNNAKDVLRATW